MPESSSETAAALIREAAAANAAAKPVRSRN